MCDKTSLMRDVWNRFKVQALFYEEGKQPWVRISAMVYNTLQDYEKLADAILTLKAEEVDGWISNVFCKWSKRSEISMTTSGVVGWKSRWGEKLQFYGSGNYGCSKSKKFSPKFPQGGGYPIPDFAFLNKKIFDKKCSNNFPTAQSSGDKCPSFVHDATELITASKRLEICGGAQREAAP